MKLRFSTIVAIFCITAAALGLYAVKYKVQNLQERVADAAEQLRAEREAVRVLEAEWTYLNRADRLQKLAEKHLKLAPVRGEQMIELADIPTANDLMTAENKAGGRGPLMHASLRVEPAEDADDR